MFLMIVTMDQAGNYRPFCCRVPKLETAFDALTSIIATGDVLISADLVENGQRTPLPVLAFDGEPIRTHIENLQSDWQTLLQEPIDTHAINHRLLSHYSRQLQATYQTRIDWLERAIEETDTRIRELPRTAYWESSCVRYEKQSTLYHQQLDQAQAGQRRIGKRFAAYLDSK